MDTNRKALSLEKTFQFRKSHFHLLKGPINSNVQIADITTILNLDQVLKAKRLELVKEKFKNISTINPYIPKNSVKCLQCSKEFYFSSFFFYHQFLCTEESTSFNLEKIIEDRSKFSSTSKTCPICNSRFQNEIIWLLHLETHLTKGKICGKKILVGIIMADFSKYKILLPII